MNNVHSSKQLTVAFHHRLVRQYLHQGYLRTGGIRETGAPVKITEVLIQLNLACKVYGRMAIDRVQIKSELVNKE